MLISASANAQSWREMKMNSLTENWLAVELSALDDDVNGWSVGIRASFDSLFDRESDVEHDRMRERKNFPNSSHSDRVAQA